MSHGKFEQQLVVKIDKREVISVQVYGHFRVLSSQAFYARSFSFFLFNRRDDNVNAF